MDFQRASKSIRTLQFDKSPPSCPLPVSGHLSIATQQSSPLSNTMSSDQEQEFTSPGTTLLNTLTSVGSYTACTTDKCPLTLLPLSTPPTPTDTMELSSTPNNPSMNTTTSPFSPRSPTPEGPTSIVGQLGTLRAVNMSSEVSQSTSVTLDEQRSLPPPFPSPSIASHSSSPILPHPYTSPLPIPPPPSPSNSDNMGPERSPSPMTVALNILQMEALTFTQSPSIPPVSSQHPLLHYPFEEHSC